MDDLKPLMAGWIRASRKAADLSQEELGALLSLELGSGRGYSKANISHWETKKHSPNLAQLVAIGKVTGAKLPQELLIAAGEKPGIDTSDSADLTAAPLRSEARIVVGDHPRTIPIKRMNVSLSAGLMRTEPAYDLTYGDDLHVPYEVVVQLQADPANLVALKVKGRSGEPMLFEDDLVVVDRSKTSPINRELFALLFDGEACVKQLVYRGAQWYLHSINPEFGPINARSGELKIIGRVVYQPGRVVTGRL